MDFQDADCVIVRGGVSVRRPAYSDDGMVLGDFDTLIPHGHPSYLPALAAAGRQAAPPLQKGLLASIFAGLLYKAREGGHKYLRRIPTGNPKRPWQYVYTESSAARDVKEGEEVVVRGKQQDTTLAKVRHVDAEGLEIEVDGEIRKLTHEDWRKLMHEMHGEKYIAWAEKRARQVANALYRHVPRALFAELPEPPAHLDALKKRAPEIYAKLEASFQRAGMDTRSAQDALHYVLSRKGWAADARGVLVGNMLDGRRPWIKSNYRQLADAATNLARAHGSAEVQASHVQAAIELRQPRKQDGDDFRKTVEAEKQAAAGELAALQALLAKAQQSKTPQDAAAALQQALASPMLAKLVELGLAFPGMRNDDGVTTARDAIAQVTSVEPGKGPRTDGSETHVFVSGNDGKPIPMPARYKLVEAEDLIASHKPGNFARNKLYPEGLQERVYHTDESEQGKVIRNAGQLEPSLVYNTNPDAVNGAPVVDSKGVVLGGNSRSMSMILAYEQGKESADKLRAYMAEHAYEVGLRPEDVKAMRNPVLVREIDTKGHDPKLLVRQLNESFTQAMDPRTMQVALARKLPESALAALGNVMGDDETLAAFLSTTRAGGLIGALRTAGIIDRRNENQYTQKNNTSKLNEDGKQLVERIILGKIVGDPDVLSDTRASLVSSISRSVPYMVQAEAAGQGYNVREDLRVALQGLNALARIEGGLPGDADKKKGGDFLKRRIDQSVESLTEMDFNVPGGRRKEHPLASNPRARALLDVMIMKDGPVQMSKIFKEFARQAKNNPEGQGGMFGPARSPDDVFAEVVRGIDDDEPKPKTDEPPRDDRTQSMFLGLSHNLRPVLRAWRRGLK